MLDIKDKIQLARGITKPQLVLKNINLINVFTGEIYKTDVAIHEGYIIGTGNYQGQKEKNMEGKYIAPGFIDGHVHIESSMVSPGQFAKAIVPRGTTTIIADPHEIANVKGLEGIEYILKDSEQIPLNVYIMLPSCVPSTAFENAGDTLEAGDLLKYMDHPRVLGLGELMDFDSLLKTKRSILNKVNLAKQFNKIIDGHGPGLEGLDLNGYAISGVKTEHECTTAQEALERLRLGMHIMLREGSAAKNLLDLLPALNNSTFTRCFFCTDDRHPKDILVEGHIDNNIRLAIKGGLSPIEAIQMATINAARCYNLKDIGAIAPGYRADFVILDSLANIKISEVYKDGKLVASNGIPAFDVTSYNSENMQNSVNLSVIDETKYHINIEPQKEVNIIKLLPHSLVTKNIKSKVVKEDGRYKDIQGNHLLKIAVVERHKQTGNIGVALVEGMGLREGAIATTIAHDSHNIVVIGDNDKDMALAVNHLKEIQGGITIVKQGEILESLSLPISGLMSDKSLEEVDQKLSSMLDLAYSMGISKDYDPFMTLSFLALPVIPELKITDLGLFDVSNFEFVNK